jgi:aminodeoxyfutalosine deaminase
MFGTTLADEYRVAAATFGLSRDQLTALAVNGVSASFLSAAGKEAIIEEIRQLT